MDKLSKIMIDSPIRLGTRVLLSSLGNPLMVATKRKEGARKIDRAAKQLQ
jgi:hypothetical protein